MNIQVSTVSIFQYIRLILSCILWLRTLLVFCLYIPVLTSEPFIPGNPVGPGGPAGPYRKTKMGEGVKV